MVLPDLKHFVDVNPFVNLTERLTTYELIKLIILAPVIAIRCVLTCLPNGVSD
jgi:hypothetical protein